MIFTNFSGDCLQRYHFYDNTHFSLGKSGQGGKGALRLTLWKAPTRETRPDHYTGNSVPYSLRQVRRFLNVPCWPYNTEDAGDGAYDLSSLSEKTGTSNHLQMSLQRHHVLLSYFKTWEVVRSRARTRDLPHSSPALYQLSLLVLSGKAAEVWFSV